MTRKQSNDSNQNIKVLEVFVGLDVHKKNWHVTLRSMGMELQTFSMNPSAVELAKHLNSHYPGATYHSAYEAGFCGFWIHRELMDNGINNIVIHAADVPTTNKEKLTKTDKVDSRKLARCLENGSIQALYIPRLEEQQIRSLCRLRHQYARHMTRLKNRIKGYLFCYGVELSDPDVAKYWSRPFIAELERLSKEPNPGGKYLSFAVDELKDHRRRLLEITKELRAFCRDSSFAEVLSLLCSVPGVGFVTAVTLLTEIIDIDRFKKLDHLCSFVGLVPTCNSSGETERKGGLSPRKNKYLKHLIIEASWIAVRRDPELTMAFAALVKRMRKTDAIIRIARKLLNRIRYVWKNQTPYRIQNTQFAQAS